MFDFFKPKWTKIETLTLQSPFAKQPDPLIIDIEAKIDRKGNYTFRKRVTRQVFDDEATNEDKVYYLTQFLLVLEYISAVNGKQVACSCAEFLRLANTMSDLEIIEDGGHVKLSDSSPSGNSSGNV